MPIPYYTCYKDTVSVKEKWQVTLTWSFAFCSQEVSPRSPFSGWGRRKLWNTLTGALSPRKVKCSPPFVEVDATLAFLKRGQKASRIVQRPAGIRDKGWGRCSWCSDPTRGPDRFRGKLTRNDHSPSDRDCLCCVTYSSYQNDSTRMVLTSPF